MIDSDKSERIIWACSLSEVGPTDAPGHSSPSSTHAVQLRLFHSRSALNHSHNRTLDSSFSMSDTLLIVTLILGFFGLSLLILPSFATPILAFFSTLLLALWNFSKLFVLGVALLLAILSGEHLYRLYLRRRGLQDPEFVKAELKGVDREQREERMKNEVEAFARQSGLHGVVKGVFRAVTGSQPKGTSTKGGGSGKASARSKAAKDGEGIELKEMGSTTGTTTPRREGLRQRGAAGAVL